MNQELMPFKKGDVVICINNFRFDVHYESKYTGEELTFLKLHEKYVVLGSFRPYHIRIAYLDKKLNNIHGMLKKCDMFYNRFVLCDNVLPNLKIM